MSKPRSSFPADSTAAAPARGPWPWLLAAGPALVVVASLVTAWLAISRSDPVVADDYYKLGLTINRRLAANPPVQAPLSATIVIGSSGDVRVRLPDTLAAPSFVRLTLRAPGARVGGVEMLAAAPDGDWSGKLHALPTGRQIVTLESDAWQLPVTVIDHLPATIRLGAAASS